MPRLAQTRPIQRLQNLLAGVEDGHGAVSSPRAVIQALEGEELQRSLVGQQWNARARLEMLSELARLAGTSPLPERERETVQAELSRIALRILWSEGLFGEGLTPSAPPAAAASRLLELAASDLLPEGPAFKVVMRRAKELLNRHDVAAQLADDDALRARLLEQLARAEERIVAI